jgi:hypothetical protein
MYRSSNRSTTPSKDAKAKFQQNPLSNFGDEMCDRADKAQRMSFLKVSKIALWMPATSPFKFV